MGRARKTSNFDDIVLAMMPPLLKNSMTSKKQAILSVGQPVGKESWKTKQEGQLSPGDL
jgi:hypothetical protein